MQAKHKKLVAALLIGGALGLVHNLLPGDGTAKLEHLLFHSVLFPLTVLWISRPLGTYRPGITIAFLAILGWTVVKFGTDTSLFMWLFWSAYAFPELVVNIVLVSIATFLRRRYYPIYPPGHCQRCGYNLTGNVSGVCPECGEKI